MHHHKAIPNLFAKRNITHPTGHLPFWTQGLWPVEGNVSEQLAVTILLLLNITSELLTVKSELK